MELDHLQDLSRIGLALWSNPERSQGIVQETFGAASLLDLRDEETVKKTVRALIERSERIQTDRADSLNHPFYRLSPTERMILTALHLGNWSYDKLAHILDLNVDQVAEIAWSARYYLFSYTNRTDAIPTGSPKAGARCPEYSSTNPWTQRFLDEELDVQRRMFLQNHMMACSACRQSLSKCRDLYYAIEALIPDYSDKTQLKSSATQLKRVHHRAKIHTSTEISKNLIKTLPLFLDRTDTKVILGVFGLILLLIAVF